MSVNKFVGIATSEDFRSEFEKNNIKITAFSYSIQKGKLVDKIVSKRLQGKSLSLKQLISNLFLTIFSGDYRAAKKAAKKILKEVSQKFLEENDPYSKLATLIFKNKTENEVKDCEDITIKEIQKKVRLLHKEKVKEQIELEEKKLEEKLIKEAEEALLKIQDPSSDTDTSTSSSEESEEEDNEQAIEPSTEIPLKQSSDSVPSTTSTEGSVSSQKTAEDKLEKAEIKLEKATKELDAANQELQLVTEQLQNPTEAVDEAELKITKAALEKKKGVLENDKAVAEEQAAVAELDKELEQTIDEKAILKLTKEKEKREAIEKLLAKTSDLDCAIAILEQAKAAILKRNDIGLDITDFEIAVDNARKNKELAELEVEKATLLEGDDFPEREAKLAEIETKIEALKMQLAQNQV